jgi:hypothetical protein
METEQMAEVYGAPGTRPSDRRAEEQMVGPLDAVKPPVKGHTLTPDELVEAVEKRPKKPSKKHKKKSRSLRDMAFETQRPSNVIMRDEMARGLHQPMRAGAVIDEIVGDPVQLPQEAGSELSEYGRFMQDVPRIALEIIDQHGSGIRTGMREWATIQTMIEEGIRRGRAQGWADYQNPPL